MFNGFKRKHIINSLIVIIQRMLFNKRRFELRRVKQINISFTRI